MRNILKGLTLAAVVLVAAVPVGAAGAHAAGAHVATTSARQSAPSCAVTWGSRDRQVGATDSTESLTGVRAGRHACYDRVVLDGASWARVRYVDQVVSDGEGEVIALRGGARLEVVTSRSDDVTTGAPTYTPADPDELVDVTGWRTLRQVAYAGNFEGQTTLGLGVRARTPFRVSALKAPDGSFRVVIDIAHRW